MSGESLTVCCLRSCHGASGAPRDGQAAAAMLTVPTRPLLSHWASLTNHKFRGEIVKTSRRATAEFETQHGPSEEQSPRDCAGHTRDAGPGHGPPRPPPPPGPPPAPPGVAHPAPLSPVARSVPRVSGRAGKAGSGRGKLLRGALCFSHIIPPAIQCRSLLRSSVRWGGVGAPRRQGPPLLLLVALPGTW